VTDRLGSLSDPQLQAALRAIGRELELPSAPGLAAAVTGRLESAPIVEAIETSRRRRRWKTTAIAIAAVLLLAATAVAVARWRIGAVSVEVVPSPLGGAPEVVGEPDFGRPATLAEAATVLGSDARWPSTLGPPEGVWIDRSFGERVVLAWSGRGGLPRIPKTDWGAVLFEFVSVPGERGPELATKEVGSSESVAETSVGGERAIWIEGRHTLTLTGSPEGPLLVTGSVLAWQQGNVTYRLETALDLEGAVALAETLR
jgi:hypothetical protein